MIYNTSYINANFSKGFLGKKSVYILNKNNYINANNILSGSGKNINNWFNNKSTKQLLINIANNQSKPVTDFYIKICTPHKMCGLYMDINLIQHLITWRDKPQNICTENIYKNYLYKLLQVKGFLPLKEYKLCNNKRIDILTANYIIEIKNVKNWVAAIGQILNYKLYLPDRKLLLVLYGTPNNITNICKICNMCNISVVFNINDFINFMQQKK